jgi:hypothetical protein
MLQYKSTTIISELQKYFGSREKAIRTLLSELYYLRISDKQFDVVDKSDTRHRGITTWRDATPSTGQIFEFSKIISREV